MSPQGLASSRTFSAARRCRETGGRLPGPCPSFDALVPAAMWHGSAASKSPTWTCERRVPSPQGSRRPSSRRTSPSPPSLRQGPPRRGASPARSRTRAGSASVPPSRARSSPRIDARVGRPQERERPVRRSIIIAPRWLSCAWSPHGVLDPRPEKESLVVRLRGLGPCVQGKALFDLSIEDRLLGAHDETVAFGQAVGVLLERLDQLPVRSGRVPRPGASHEERESRHVERGRSPPRSAPGPSGP